MFPTPNGAIDTEKEYQWKPEFDELLEHIAQTDTFDMEWSHVKNLIRRRVDYNVRQYLSGVVEPQDYVSTRKTPPLPQSSPLSLPSSSPSSYPGPSSVPQGLIIPPFPKRTRRPDAPMQPHHSVMDTKEADQIKGQIFDQLNEIENAPFTIQRICELCIRPRKHYKTVGKYLCAMERTIRVTSTRDAFPVDEEVKMAPMYGSVEARLASTPLMSPIPFLHQDARRSRSPSPFELVGTKRPVLSPGELNTPSVQLPSGRQPLGLVDELDDPKPGHLAEHPTALTSVTSTEQLPPLSERFVKSSTLDGDGGSMDMPETLESGQAEDAEVEDMVLDESTLEDEDKENRPS